MQAELAARGYDALLAFEPESVTYLTGFYTRGYATFQFAVIPVGGEPGILCRDVAQYYLDRTAVCRDNAVWADGDDRMAVAQAFLRRKLGGAGRVAVELGAWQLNAQRWAELSAALPEGAVRGTPAGSFRRCGSSSRRPRSPTSVPPAARPRRG